MHPHLLPSRFLSVALALLVLAASIGLPVQRRTCRLSGRSTARISWNAAAAGALGNQDRSAQSGMAACYAFSLQLHQISPETSAFGEVKLVPASTDWLALPASLSLGLPAAPRLFAPALAAGPFANRPPPSRPGGRTLLVRLGTLVV